MDFSLLSIAELSGPLSSPTFRSTENRSIDIGTILGNGFCCETNFQSNEYFSEPMTESPALESVRRYAKSELDKVLRSGFTYLNHNLSNNRVKITIDSIHEINCAVQNHPELASLCPPVKLLLDARVPESEVSISSNLLKKARSHRDALIGLFDAACNRRRRESSSSVLNLTLSSGLDELLL